MKMVVSIICVGFVRALAVTAALYVTAMIGRAEPPASPRGIAEAFESTVVRLSVPPDAVAVPLGWDFTNHWDFPLVVESFELSCGCLAGAVDASEVMQVAPGARGRIRATFTPGPYRGTIRKSLRVRFVAHEKSVELVAEATIPSAVELSTNQLRWIRGGEREARSVELTAGTGTAFRITGVSGAPASHYRIERETLVADLHYRITITPTEAADEGVKTLLIRTDSADPRDRVKAVFLTMRPAGDSPRDHSTKPPADR